MKRAPFFVALLLLATSCSNKENSDPGTASGAVASPLNKFRFNDTTYAVTGATRQTSGSGDAVLVATGEEAGKTCVVRFIADSARLTATALRVGTHLWLTVDGGLSNRFYSFGRTTVSRQQVDAVLTTDNGTMTVTVPELWMYRAGGSGPDSVRFSANAVSE